MISKNKNLTIDFVRKFKKKLNFNILSENPCFTMKMLSENDDLPWNISMFSRNPSLTLDLIEKNLDKLDILKLSSNPCLTPDFINRHPEIEWCLISFQNNNMKIGLERERKNTFLNASMRGDQPINNFFNHPRFDRNVLPLILKY